MPFNPGEEGGGGGGKWRRHGQMGVTILTSVIPWAYASN